VEIVFTTHAFRRMLKRHITTVEVETVLLTGVRIEEYQDDQPLPSYLVLGRAGARVLHVIAADDPERGETLVITSYEPNTDLWELDFKTRRRSR